MAIELTLAIIIFVMILAFGCEYIDSALGMGYGTIMSPVLILLGFDPLLVVPSILFSEAFSGFSSSIMHHYHKNIDFTNKEEKHLKVVYLISGLSVVATILTVILVVNVPKIFVSAYIGIIVLLMGLLLISNLRFAFSWKKITVIGVVSAFNKTISGGGFGPLVTAGQVISGRETKPSIAVTGACEIAVCVVGFIMYFILNGIETFILPIAMAIASVSVTPLATFTTKQIKKDVLARRLVGVVCAVLGVLTILSLIFGFKFST